jgi:L-ribulose-5-phosphate 4-epimerase
MTTVEEKTLSADVLAFIDKTTADAKLAIRVLRETGTLSASRTLNFIERVPGEDLVIAVDDPEPWADVSTLSPGVVTFEGTVLSGSSAFGVKNFVELFEKHPEITTVAHVHTPYLGGWAQTHRIFPIRYAAAQRLTLSREIHPHVDRRGKGVDFILERLEKDPHTVGVFEGNGGANVLGRGGLLETAKLILFLEEGAQFQILAEAAGGSQEFGPGTLHGQWTRTGLADEAIRLGLISSFLD